jgi:phospholipid-translocating ATPase
MSLYQACFILLMTVTLFNESFTNIVTISFTSLILVEVINVLMEVKSIKLMMVGSCVITFVLYLISIFIFKTMFDLAYINWVFMFYVTIIAFTCCFPLWMFKFVKRCVDPSKEDKITRT